MVIGIRDPDSTEAHIISFKLGKFQYIERLTADEIEELELTLAAVSQELYGYRKQI